MKTTSIHVEGQIISPEIFDGLDSNEVPGQLPQDFGFERGIRVKDEITRAWADAKDQWNIFKRRAERLSDTETGTTETRKFWILPLLEFLGYNLSIAKAEEVNGNSFAISHRDQKLEGFPVHIVGINDSMDKRREAGGPRLSPHALLQEYLNITEHIYGIVTNGYQLRLLRNSGKLIRLTYLEFDLLHMLEDDLFAEFSLMYRLLHASRMPQKFGEGDSSVFEKYHQLSLEAGARIRDKLSKAVEKSIISVANGFLKHPMNKDLREKIKTKHLKEEEYFQYLLRFIYRVLFLMVLEERDIIYPHHRNEQENYFHDIYFNYYSISRIRKLADNIFFFDEKLEDLWISLRNSFKIFGSERLAAKLGIYPLDGELFDYSSLGILSDSSLDNHTLLECIRNLSVFENDDTKSIIRVNYAALNVEEFGSVYEGLLEKAAVINNDGDEFRFHFVKGTERSSSGSHYTPEELVQPLIKHSLDYVIEEKLKLTPAFFLDKDRVRQEKEEALLSIKVCDVACGSGHILLSAARRIAQELTKVRTGEDQPAPEPFREALRDVINHCIYGVDKNPLAVELCKVALWLEAHNPGMPLNFLDHRIKCGDSIVGLARIEELYNGISTEAFKRMPDDDKDIASAYAKKNRDDIKNRTQLKLTDTQEVIEKLNSISVKFKDFNELPDNTVEAVKKKTDEYNVLKGDDWWKLKKAADVQVAQFFFSKTNRNKDFITTDEEYFRILAGQKAGYERKISEAMALGVAKKFFHWFLEFPEVMQEGGFDCIIGNPPYLGGTKISTYFGGSMFNYVKTWYMPAAGRCDLAGYFVRRVYNLLKLNSFLSLITTNTISEGDTREGSLDQIIIMGGSINHAFNSLRWPGTANVIVTLLTVYKGSWKKNYFLQNRLVGTINAYLTDQKMLGNPEVLLQNNEKAFMGSCIMGEAFLLSESKVEGLLKNNNKNSEVISHYLNGESLNNDPNQNSDRWIINFKNLSLEEAKNYIDCLEICEDVKIERSKKSMDVSKFSYWKYWRIRKELYKKISKYNRVFVQARSTKTHAIAYIDNVNKVYSDAIIVFAINRFSEYSILQSTLHDIWAWQYSSSLKTDRRYSVSDCFETFPFPQRLNKEIEEELEIIGEEYHEFRRQLMLDMQIGLTKTYNLFHDPECNLSNIEKAKDIREFKQAKLQIPLEEAIQRIEKLRELHKQMDEAVLKAYGWTDVNLAHKFYEVDYLPEQDRIRYTISPEARKEILKRLLELNHKINSEEVAVGLWEKKGKKKNKIPAGNENQEKLF
jgi:hypothetical protein